MTDEERQELMMVVDGMAGEAGGEAVRAAIRRLDPEAEVAVDLAHGRVTVTTRAQSVEVADALAKAGFEARAMTG